jgi:hypothetical protein
VRVCVEQLMRISRQEEPACSYMYGVSTCQHPPATESFAESCSFFTEPFEKHDHAEGIDRLRSPAHNRTSVPNNSCIILSRPPLLNISFHF